MNDSLKMFKTKDIVPDSYFSEPVYMDEKFILATPDMPFGLDLIQALEDWEVQEVFSSGENSEGHVSKAFLEDSSDLLEDSSPDFGTIDDAEEFYISFLGYTRNLFVHATVGNELDFDHVAKRIKELCNLIRRNRTILLRIQKTIKVNPEENFLASHSVKSTIISIIIGSYFKLPAHRLIELGVSALLHEIGMVKLHPRVYLSKNPLKPMEKKAIFSHPAQGYNLLKANGFPLSVMLAALEHHERDNGSGYPRNLTGDKISLYAKIIAVACSYEAISSKRPHKEAKDGYMGMLELLRNEGKQYDDTIIRALVYSLSLYPVGLYVLLSNEWKGQVVDVNPEDPRFPIVQVSGIHTGSVTRKIHTSQNEIYIVRPLTGLEMETENIKSYD